jgi:hypothetical protein
VLALIATVGLVYLAVARPAPADPGPW